ncbi:MAG TPA: ABC transporter permease [Persephonella sp.]|uniref:Oligopeptide transport system permease protein AppB n=1 Tax=Persephonella marina (strain DSM 14350 / EX-H1) TaxID=123214 RepID=C0QQ79_PERMH|nr:MULTISPECIES: ABC transporter permease [Persephonella]ACO04361.1 oligopeptide transport system permease protein AppB [Persephonella marina EX-H1]HCB69568.1 ABC transporter permease [Persephonella sp.]
MFQYIIKRLIQMIPLVIGITFISFLIIQMAPGSYLDQLKMNPQISKETLKELERAYGLDQPLLVQYFKWLINALKFDLGYSFSYHVPVLELIKERIGNTLFLSITSGLLAWILAVPLGIWAALNPNRWIDKFIQLFSFTFMSIPNFFLAFLMLFVAVKTGIFPTGGATSPDYDQMSLWGKILDRLWHVSLPAFVLGIGSLAGLVRLVRSAMIEAMQSEYVMFARAKGLPERDVIFKHALRNALNPFITLLGFEIASLLSGAALVEIIVNWPGMGMLMLDAVLSQDLYLVMGGLYIGAIMLIIGNLIADILLAKVDPRVRQREIEGVLK